jgi:hypothetical protein
MSALPRIFVGTLACGEAELEECRAAVAAQEGVSATQVVISNLREREAHHALWDVWDKHKADHDIFVKIDADTVLSRRTALREIADLFDAPEVTGAQIPLHDYFTDRLIAGLNAFSKAVVFRKGRSRLMPDRVDIGHVRLLKGPAVSHLAPIGWHCRAPHARQAFHFGLHRALKKQHDVIARCAEVWLARRDEPRGWALSGAMSARWRMRFCFDYAQRGFERAFIAQAADAERLTKLEAFARNLFRSAAMNPHAQ